MLSNKNFYKKLDQADLEGGVRKKSSDTKKLKKQNSSATDIKANFSMLSGKA